MKIIVLPLFFLVNIVSAQLKNADFEISGDSISSLPKNWKSTLVGDSHISLDNTAGFSGKNSLKIESGKGVNKNAVGSITQEYEIEIPQLKKIRISAYIKTEKLNGSASLICRLMDGNDKPIGVETELQQDIHLAGSNDWKQYDLTILTGADVKKLRLGGFLTGEGTVWFDHFTVENMDLAGPPAPKEVARYTKEFTRIIRSNAFYSDSINWDSLNADIQGFSNGIQTIQETRILITYVLNKLRAAGDNHSGFVSKEAAAKIASGNIAGAEPEGSYLQNNIGYIKVPGFGSLNDTACINFATKIQDLIKSIDNSNTIKGWIVDLRENGGGNMHPMIAGVGPLLGDGIAGYIIELKKETPWSYSKGVCSPVKVALPYSVKDPGAKVAVLIGAGTASSGEATAISFIGKSNARLFGQPTAGYTTANRGFPLSDGSYLYLATGYEADRNKKKYLHNIDPDVIVKIQSPGEQDKTLEVAKKWIMDHDE